jgi:predicted Zn finger-like uncharacterized protein
MPITFSCDNCHSSFTVDSQLAGRTARCRKCGERMVIPAPAARRPEVGAAKGLRQSSAEGGRRSVSWVDAVNSQIGLKPITAMSMPAVRQRDLDDEDDPRSQYKVIIPREMRQAPAIVTIPAEFAWATYLEGIRSYRQFFNVFAILFRKINETAYGVSLIFLNLAIVGGIMGKHSLVVTGMSMVVLLNVVQLVAGVSNLIAIQFRGNVVQGLLFLFPPVTAFYLWKNWTRWNKAIQRITSPIVWLVIVVVAYTFVPWLNGNADGSKSWQDAVKTIKKDVGGTVSDIQRKAADIKEQIPAELEKAKLDELQKSAGEAVGDLKSQAEKALGGSRRTPQSGSGKAAEPIPKQTP